GRGRGFSSSNSGPSSLLLGQSITVNGKLVAVFEAIVAEEGVAEFAQLRSATAAQRPDEEAAIVLLKVEAPGAFNVAPCHAPRDIAPERRALLGLRQWLTGSHGEHLLQGNVRDVPGNAVGAILSCNNNDAQLFVGQRLKRSGEAIDSTIVTNGAMTVQVTKVKADPETRFLA